jgi:CHAP domain-containing protein
MTKTLVKLMLGLTAGLFAACGAPSGEVEDASELVPTTEEASAPPYDTVEQALTCGTCGTRLTCLDGSCVYANDKYQATGTSCASDTGYGPRYQCVEFARRYWNQTYGRTFGRLGSAGAQGICDLAPNGYDVHWQGDGYTPVHGDLFVRGAYTGNPYGHVAVVNTVTSTSVNVVEQNGSCSGVAAYPRSYARCFLHMR